MARPDVTQKDGTDSCNSCPMYSAMLTAKQKTCSVKCRVALHRRLARQGTPDGAGAILSVASRVFKKEMYLAQIAVRNTLRQRHKQERGALRQEYLKRSSAMQDEITASNAAVARQCEAKLLQQSEEQTLGMAISENDKNTGERIYSSLMPRERKGENICPIEVIHA